MAEAWYIVPIIGTGTKEDFYRVECHGMVDYSASIPSNADGTPQNTEAITFVSAPDLSVLDANPKFIRIAGADLDTKLSAIDSTEQTKVQSELIDRGVNLDGITPTSTFRELLLRAGSKLDSDFKDSDLRAMDVR